MKIVLIPCGPSTWRQAGRLLGRTEIGLTDQAEQRCAEWAEQLRPLGIQRLYHAPDELATQTARLLGRRLNVPVRALDELAEVDCGLWTGLTEAQIRERFASAFHQLADAPLSVQPPGGEALAQAAQRLRRAVQRIARRGDAQTVGLVLRPVALGLARCVLDGADPARLWSLLREPDEPRVLNWPADAPAAGTPQQEGSRP